MPVLFSEDLKNKHSNIVSLFRIRFFSKHREEPYVFWRELLGFPPHDPGLYETAMCHKSAIQPDTRKEQYTNERLEFLGDAILSAVFADILLEKFPMQPEGFLTRTRAKIVCRATLNELARQLGLDKRIKKAPYVDRNIENLYGNAFEALIGAIYVDYGYAHCKQFVERIIRQKYINIEKIARSEVDFKSRLLEWGQRHQLQIRFLLAGESFNEKTNGHIFHYQIDIEGTAVAEAKGATKREAQQAAAAIALKNINRQQNTTKFHRQIHSKTTIA